jgi:phage-related protein
MGYGLFLAQLGERHATMAKTMSGFHGAAVVELRERSEEGAYRTVYTVQFGDAVYVLHAFQKKSKRGIATPRQEIEIVKRRLKEIEEERSR